MFGPVMVLAIALLFQLTVSAQVKTDRERANLLGPVKSVSESYTKYKNGKPEQRDTVKYDLKGNEIERSMISDFGEPMGRQLQSFDGSGNIKESRFIDSKGKDLERQSFSYTDGRLVQVLTYVKSVVREKTVRAYDAKGNLIKETYFDPNIERGETVYTKRRFGQSYRDRVLPYGRQKSERAYWAVPRCSSSDFWLRRQR